MSKKLNDPSTAQNFIGLFSVGFSIIKRDLFLQSFITVKLYQTSKKRPTQLIHFFAFQYTPVSNSSVLPDISFHTNARLNLFSITEKDILAIIKSLDPNKSHGWDNISIKMIKMCGESLALPLKMIFEAALNDGVFPDDWKKGNIVPVHKKDLKTMLINYHPISLLPIFAKIFVKIIFTSMFEYFIENKLFHSLSVWFSSRRFLLFVTLKYYT